LYSLRSVSFGSGEGLVVGDMCSGELAAEAATAAAARLRWRREAGWDPRFLLLVLEVLLAMALAVVVSSAALPNQVFVYNIYNTFKSFHSR
jgi:hypothetical protein